MTDERCERTDLIKTQCAHCLGHADPVADALEFEHLRLARYAPDDERSVVISAKFPGSCTDCGEEIRVDDQITVVGGGGSPRRWVCAGCAP